MTNAGELIHVSDGRIYAEGAGQGPALVWIHAAIADHRMWDREFREYASRYQVIRYDVRGLGRSPPASAPYSDIEDLRGILDRFHVSRVTLVGCSNGGRLAIDFALSYPKRVEALVLVAPGLGGYELSGDPQEKATFDRSNELLRPVFEAYKAGKTELALEGMRGFWCAAQTGPSLALVQQMMRDNAAEIFTDASASHATPLHPPAAGRLGAITARTLVVRGDRDAEESVYFVDRVAAGIPGATKRLIPGADHLVNLSRPREFDEALRPILPGRN